MPKVSRADCPLTPATKRKKRSRVEDPDVEVETPSKRKRNIRVVVSRRVNNHAASHHRPTTNVPKEV